jgi:hypothetical protein
MSDGLEAAPVEAAPAEVAAPQPAAKSGRWLLPFYGANLAAIYLPSLLPIALEIRRNIVNEEPAVDKRALALDLLAAPWAGLNVVVDRGVYAFAETLGNVGSLYAFLLLLWIGVLLISIAYCNYRRRLWLTFLLFVLSTAQAIFLANRLMAEEQQDSGEPPPPAAAQPLQP